MNAEDLAKAGPSIGEAAKHYRRQTIPPFVKEC
jgi:hypothetical protein